MKLKYTGTQKAIEVITIILLLFIWIYLILSWNSIPDKIPGHYNAQGIVDRWGNKGEILTIPILSIVLYALLTTVSFFPSTWNVPVKITDDNKELVYANLITMLILIKMEVIATFGYISYCNISIRSLGAWFLPLELIIIFGTVTYYLIRISKK